MNMETWTKQSSGGDMVRKAVLVISILFCLGNFRPVQAAGNEPLIQIRDSVDEIVRILQREDLQGLEKRQERRQQVLKVVRTMFDFKTMARSALARDWNERTTAEQEEFVGLFSRLVEHRYIGKIDDYSGQTVVFTKQLVSGDKAIIYSALNDKDTQIPMVYKLRLDGSRWVVYDMQIENVSLVVNYRRDFASIIKSEKYQGLVRRISEQLVKLDEQES